MTWEIVWLDFEILTIADDLRLDQDLLGSLLNNVLWELRFGIIYSKWLQSIVFKQ